MKKVLKYIFISLITVFLIFRIGKWTGFLQSYVMSTSSNEPKLEVDEFVFGSNLFKPKKSDLVIYLPNKNEIVYGTWIHRLCAVEKDTVEIKNGVLFVNGKNVDKNLNLKHSYVLNIDKLSDLKVKLKVNDYNYYHLNRDSIITHLTEKEAKIVEAKRYIKNGIDSEIKKVYNKDWNENNFGPLVIPKGFVFVLGDNRDNSIDSRFLGLTPIEKLKGKLLFQ